MTSAPPPPCETPTCGQARGRGRPPAYWWAVRQAGSNHVGRQVERGWVWYCTRECLVRGLGVAVVGSADQGGGRLADLNRLAGTCLTVMDITPHRLKVALARAFDRLTREVEDQAAKDGRGRPSQAVLLAEALGSPVASRICSRCDRALTLDEFGESRSWCRTCHAEYYRRGGEGGASESTLDFEARAVV